MEKEIEKELKGEDSVAPSSGPPTFYCGDHATVFTQGHKNAAQEGRQLPLMSWPAELQPKLDSVRLNLKYCCWYKGVIFPL